MRRTVGTIRVAAVLAAIAALAPSAWTRGEPAESEIPSRISSTQPTQAAGAGDAAFVREALEGGRKEVAEAREAMMRTKREDLRSTAQMLMTEHMNMNAELEHLAAKKGWEVKRSSSPPAAAADSREGDGATADEPELDRTFIETQIEEHERTIEMFRRQSTGARDTELRELAARCLPRLEQHLDALKELET